MPQSRRVARAAVTGAAAAACLTLATPAWASSTIPLHTPHKGSTAAAFETRDCTDRNFGSLPAGQDGWHFVLPTKAAGNFEALTLTFEITPGNTVTLEVPDTNDPHTDFLSTNGNGDGQVKHAYVFTPAGWTLVDGSATISGEANRFNLSHTCPGTPDTSTGTPAPTPTTPDATPTATTPAGTASPTPTTPGETPAPGETPSTPAESATPSAGTGGGDGAGSLPLTGVAGTSIVLTGLVLIGGGVALTMLRRRRDKVTFTS